MLNETNITIDVAKIVINSQGEGYNYWTIFFQLIQYFIPILSIIATGYIAYYTIKNNARNVFIQANQEKINEAIATLAEKIQRGQVGEIKSFLNSSEGIYIPKSLKVELRKDLNEIDLNKIEKMLDEISKYLSP